MADTGVLGEYSRLGLIDPPVCEWHIWVWAHSVFSKLPVLRQAKTSELMAICDYKGKLESWGWSCGQCRWVLEARLPSSPGKMLRCFRQSVCNAILLKLHNGLDQASEDEVLESSRGFTADIPFSPLEAKATTCAVSAQADHAKVDLSAWNPPLEMEEEAQARAVLRQFAACWWAHNLGREAMWWWDWNGWDLQHFTAIQDCIYQARACSYWHWHCGSCLFFWRFPREFQRQMRDGTPFYHLAASPVGYTQNMPSPSQQAEIKTWKKVFQLQYWHNIERGFTNLITRHFSIVKLEVDGEIQEIRVVWNSKSNGHIASLWAPGFMLNDIGDVIEMMTKWLSTPVAAYLNAGSPHQDYTQLASSFVKSKQGGIDVGAMFNNFSTHPLERHTLGVHVIHT
jgi:hypothetical protein